MAKIIGLGAWFPEQVRTNQDWSPEVVQSFQDRMKRDLLDIADHGLIANLDPFTLQKLQQEKDDPFLGAVERRILPEGIPSYQAEVYAAEIALTQANISPQEIGAVFSFSAMDDRVGINATPKVASQLGIKKALACELDAACSSHVVQMMIASALVDTSKVGCVLLVVSNIMSRGLPMPHPASPGVGDCATAMLIASDDSPGHPILNAYARSDGDYWDAVVWRRKPTDSQSWYQAGGPFYLGSYNSGQARQLVQMTAQCGAQTIQEAAQEISLSQVDFMVSVQPRQWVPVAIARLLGLRDDQTLDTYQQYAHVGCCGPVVNLLEAERRGLLQAGQTVAMYAQGAGFTRAATLIRW